MKLQISIRLPIYFKYKNRQTLTGLNVFRNLHYTTKNKLKKNYEEMVKEQLKDVKTDTPYNGEYRVTMVLYYKNVLCDLPNICSMIDKFTLDALVNMGLLANDNVKRYVETSYKVGGLDKDNPRVEIFIEGCDN